MQQFATITPSRGDRPELLGFTMRRLNVPYKIACIEPPATADIDIIPRIKHGIEVAKRNGYDFVFIVEDDDYYPADYFASFGDLSNVDFVGYSDTIYYHLKNKTWQWLYHNVRASLFCTGFRISALDRFDWPRDNYKWLDVKLWDYADMTNKRIRLLNDNPTLGMKGHGQGLAAGKGHSMYMKNQDPDLSFLKSRVDEEAFEFYQKFIK